MNKQFILFLTLLAAKESCCQQIDPAQIDSIIICQNNIPDTYQYDYSLMEKEGALNTRFDFRSDTTTKQLLKAIYTEEGNRVLIVTYYFYHNNLVKVESMTRDEAAARFPVGVYYFYEKKLLKKKGKNISLQNEKLFKKISARSIIKQQEYLLSIFQYFIKN